VQSNVSAAQSTLAGTQFTVTGAESTVAGAEAGLVGTKSTLAGSEAALATAQATYDRLKKASATPGAVAGNDLDAALKSVEVQRAAVEAQRAAVDSQRAHVEALRAAAQTQRSTVASQEAGMRAQEAGIQAQQAVIRAQEAGIEAQRAAVQALRSEQDAAEASIRVAKTMREYLRVTAPFAGIVTERNVHPGSLVGPNASPLNPPLVRIDDIAKLRLTVGVPETYVGAIGAGAAVTFSVPAFPDERFRGVVQRKAYALDPKTRTMAVEVDVDNPGARLAPGMFATVNWPITRTAASYFVPPSAIVSTTEKTFVIAVREGIATWVDVRRGVSDGTLMEVFGNLNPNDVVVKRGVDEIRNGTKITTK
jgi:RND family efflux transporter MFP subunit